MHVVIRNKIDPTLYWKSGQGWVPYKDCNSFGPDLVCKLPLPPGGEWHTVVPIIDPSEMEQPVA